MPEKSVNQPKVGMKFSNPSDLTEGEFSLLVNGQIESINGNFLKVTNSHSNILCNRFNDYKVIGVNYLPSEQLTFYFLVDVTNNKSEIGFIYDQVNKDKRDKEVQCSTCNTPIVEDAPLETQEQVESCTYHTFVNADCLNFNIDFPISSWIKIDDCNIRIYFTDNYNKPRYIDYNDFQKINLSNCPLIETNELDCEKIKIFPETCYPEVVVTDVVSGGQNTSGVFQFTACYADVRANKVTDCFFISNPTPLFNNPITIDEEYPVAKSIKLRISNLNKEFKYFNLYVLKTIKGVTTPKLIETFEVNSTLFTYIYTGIEKNIQQNISIDEIIGKRPHYTKAKTISESNGYSFLSELSENRILNLQPVINKLPLIWQSVVLNEGDYANPLLATNNVGYLGDEVYPFAIQFTNTDGTNTARFTIPGREITSYDNEIIDNNDVIEVHGCETDPRNKRWQVYNTASVLGSAPSGSSTNEVTSFYNCTSLPFQIKVDTSVIPYLQTYYKDDGVTVLTEEEVLALCDGCTNPYVSPDIHPLPAPNDLPVKVSPITGNDLILYTGIDVNGNFIINPNSSLTLLTKQGQNSVNHYLATPPGKIPFNPSVYSGTRNMCLRKDFSEKDDDGKVIAVHEGFLTKKDNVDPFSNLPNLPQSTRQNCVLDEWGSFVANYNETPDYVNHTVTMNGTLPSGSNFSSTPFKDKNQSWYTFTATGAVSVIRVNTANPKLVIEVWSKPPPPILPGTPNTDYFYNTLLTPTNTPPELIYFNALVNPYEGYFLLAKNTTLNESDLIQGNTYYVKIYSAEGGDEFGTGTPCNADFTTSWNSCSDRPCCPDCYFNICVVTPNADSVTTEYTNNIVQANCLWKFTYTTEGVQDSYCNVANFKYGNMAYWESVDTYPCNEEVYAELAGKPIRHHKFPDFSISPFFNKKDLSFNNLTPNTNNIFPKGVVVSVKDIKQLLIEAEEKGLITGQERANICGYRILRGNRRGNESIIAKGLVYDVWSYTDNVYDTGNQIMFPNFPFNDNNENKLIQTRKIKGKSDISSNDNNLFLKHPYPDTKKNYKYSFHSPNTSFNNPGLGIEVKIECEQTGIAIGSYQNVKNNTEYQYVGAGIISASIGFATVEAAFEGIQTILTAAYTLDIKVVGTGVSVPIGMILAIIYENFLSPIRLYSFYAEWLEIIKKFAPFRNYAMYYIAQGNYDNWSKDGTGKSTVVEGNIRRAINNTQYIKDGILNIKTQKGYEKLNNFKRESAVFIENKKRTNVNNSEFFPATTVQDTSRWSIGDFGSNCDKKSASSTIASYYAAIKNLLVDQYGQIDNIEYIDTGYNGRIEWNNDLQDTTTDTIFGGDTYINRFSLKRKVPLFLDDRVIPSNSITVPADNLDINLSEIPNIGYPVYFMNYPTGLDYDISGAQSLFGDVAIQSDSRVDFNFLCYSASGQSWAKTGLAAAILGGISAAIAGIWSLPIFTGVISDAIKKDLGNDVYLNGKYVHSMYGISSFLTESNYNLDYRHGENTKEKDFYPHVGDIINWTQECVVPMYYDNYYFYNNDYSKQNKENFGFILNNDFKQTKEDCKVIHPNRTIYSLQDNDQNDRFDGNLIYLANNYYEFSKSGGKLKILKGIDNNKVLVIQENQASVFNSYISQETNIAQSTVGTNSLFNKSLPQQYIKTDLGFGGSQTSAFISTEYGQYWVDNLRGQVMELNPNPKVGINNIIPQEDQWWFKENLPFKILEDFKDVDIDNNFKYFGMCIVYDARYKRVIFTKRDAQLKEEWRGLVENQGDLFYDTQNKKYILPTNSTYFCDKSFTISYSPLTKTFTSFHSYTPNYYVPNQNYFSSGINYSTYENPSENGVWTHGLTNKSYTVYYGKKYPYILEYSLQSKAQNKVLNSVESITEYRRFQDNLSSAMVNNKFFDTLTIYNQNQTTGKLELVVKEKNNLFQYTQYPKQTPTSRIILTENIENIFRINDWSNVALQNGQPIMLYPCHSPYSQLNPKAISYAPKYLKDLMRSDYFSLRLEDNTTSNYQIISRFEFTNTTNSIS